MKKFRAVFAALLIIVCYLLTCGIRALAGALNMGGGTFEYILLAFLGFAAAFFALFGFSLSFFAIFEKRWLLFAVSAAATFVGGLVCGLLTAPFEGAVDSVLMPLLFAVICFGAAFGLSFILKYRPVYFAVSAVAAVFVNILFVNGASAEAVTAVGALFPFVRIYSDIGLDKGVIAYILYVVIFLLHYLVLRKCFGLFAGRKGK